MPFWFIYVLQIYSFFTKDARKLQKSYLKDEKKCFECYPDIEKKIENKELRIESKAGFGITEKKKIIEKTGK